MQKYIFISEEFFLIFHNLFPCLTELTTILNYTFLWGVGRGLDGGEIVLITSKGTEIALALVTLRP